MSIPSPSSHLRSAALVLSLLCAPTSHAHAVGSLGAADRGSTPAPATPRAAEDDVEPDPGESGEELEPRIPPGDVEPCPPEPIGEPDAPLPDIEPDVEPDDEQPEPLPDAEPSYDQPEPLPEAEPRREPTGGESLDPEPEPEPTPIEVEPPLPEAGRKAGDPSAAGEDPDEPPETETDPPPKPLPEHGYGDRPQLPNIDVDMLQLGAGMVGQGAAAISFGKLGEDYFLFLALSAVFAGDDWQIAPRIPLRLRIVDQAPKNDSVIRLEDWDEVSDFARLLAFFQWGHPGDALLVRYGELNGATLGHGSLVNRYYNTVDIDHYQGGIFATGDAGIVGGEIMLDNLLDPEVLGARLFVRPLDMVTGLPFMARKLKVAITAGGDIDAPVAVATDEDGRILVGDNFQPRITKSDQVSFVGTDVEVPLVSMPHFDLVPYVDANLLDGAGLGVHVGAFVNVRFTELAAWNTRVEYRYSGRHYEPSYVSPFYEIQRVRYRNDLPKLTYLSRRETAETRHGVYLESELGYTGVFRLTVVFSEETGADNTDLLARLQLPALGPVSLSLFFARLGFDSADDFFDAKNTVFAASGRYHILDWLFVSFRVVNEWWLRHDRDGSSEYETTIDFDAGIGLSLDF